MKLIPRRDPGPLTSFRNEIDELLQRFVGDFDGGTRLPAAFRQDWTPAVDVAETEKSFTFAFELPGLSEKDIQIQLVGNQLVVSAERKWEEEKKGKEFHRVESQYGAFERAVELPANARAQSDAIQATYKRGILEISVPKVEPTPAAKIPVKVG